MNIEIGTNEALHGSNDETKVQQEKRSRKKFAVPPVKIACLECRASRTRCDGGKPQCSNCTLRSKTCVYTQSKRGGARIRKRAVSGVPKEEPSSNKDLNHCLLSVLPELDEASFTGPLSLVAPGGGLKQLDLTFDETSFMFDSVFTDQNHLLDSGYETSVHTPSDIGLPQYLVRTYSSDQDILNAYYVYIHPYFPVLPPPEAHQAADKPEIGVRRDLNSILTSRTAPDFEPYSPISLAISATLTLIPHPDDPDPSGTNSVQLRRSQAQAFAQTALESIEIESELLDSVIDPGSALSNDSSMPSRTPFHPCVPIEQEAIVALLLLSTYEYAQRGNIAKMRNRAGQALTAAMNLGLHAKDDMDGLYAEANRRTWWMTYIIVCQTAILSNSVRFLIGFYGMKADIKQSPPILLYDPRFTTPGPTFEADMDSWDFFLQSQQAITSATQFVIDLDATTRSKRNPSSTWDRMLELDAILEPLIAQADSWTLTSTSAVSLDQSEMNVAQALRGIARIKLNSARIKLHRYCAFSDVPIFTKKHCDLPSIKDTSTRDRSAPPAPACSCSDALHSLTPSQISPASTTSPLQPNFPILPFTPHASAKICLKSAFNIASSFNSLPYPQLHPNEISYFPQVSTPASQRTVPIFACCAMQASYAMIMLSYKTRAMGFAGDGTDEPALKLVKQLREALGMILNALKNYSGAFEAVGGMRDQIELAVTSMNDLPIPERMG